MFPCRERPEVLPDGSDRDPRAEKTPYTVHGYQNATKHERSIRGWWRRWPDALIGRPTGAASGVVVVDVDIDPARGIDGTETLDALTARHGPLPETWTASTPRGGTHYYFRHPGAAVACSVSRIGRGIDIRGDGGYVIAPPSTLADGRGYEWLADGDPEDGSPLADLPSWLAALISAPERPQAAPERSAGGHGAPIPAGERNATLASLAGTMRRRGMGADAIRAALMAENAARCQPPLPKPEIQRIADSVSRYEPAPEQAIPTNWPAPEPLPSGLPPVAPFAPELLPAALRPWVADIAQRMQCPPDYSAVAAMVTLAGIVGRQVAIRPKRYDDWTVTPNLWGAVVGRPSLLKTPAIQEPIGMVEAFEAHAREEFERETRHHEADLMVTKAKTKEAEDGIKKAVKAKDSDRAHQLALDALSFDAPPVRRRYVTQDTTVEKLGELLRDSPRGILVYRDELVGFLRSLDQEGREGARAFYLEAWNGTGSFRFDRIGRGTVEIEAACVSIIGGIQPGPLGDYMVAAIRGGLGDDGLVQRFQLAVWPDAPREWRNIDRWPDTEARRIARAVYERLDQIDPQAIGAAADEGDRIPWLRFDAAAQDLFDEWRGDLEQRIRGDLHPALESHLAKFRSLVPSLALLCHLADAPEGGPVSEQACLRALAWSEYLETHARRIYAPALAPDMAAAAELDRRLAALPEPFTAKDVYRNHWRLLDRTGTADALAVLEEFGRIRGEQSEGPGRPTVRYRVHPDLRGGVQ